LPTSRYIKIRSLASNTKGGVGERLLKEIKTRLVSEVLPRINTQHDWIIDKRKTEVKLACLNNDGIHLKLGHIRPDDDWEFLYLVGVYPDTIRLWGFDKNALRKKKPKS
jgi:hypothetical protein